jgi:hypothetical protein
MSDNDGCIIFVGFILIALLLMFVGYGIGRDSGFKKGYVQSLADIEAKKEPKYKLVKQTNGEAKWVEVER